MLLVKVEKLRQWDSSIRTGILSSFDGSVEEIERIGDFANFLEGVKQDMGQAKIRQREGFAPKLIEEWEAEDCVNFAVALARITGWLLHVDWLTPSDEEDIPESELKPLRVYVGDNREGVFDVRGVKSIEDFSQGTVFKIAKSFNPKQGGIRTRYYDEAALLNLPLKYFPTEEKIAIATEAIKARPQFLNAIPAKPQSKIPAYHAARYTFGKCVAYAEALRELTGLQTAAIMVKKFTPFYRGTIRSDDGYVHSIVVHPDGMGEDAWGLATIDNIASRFGALLYEVSYEAHQEVVQNYLRTSNNIYQSELNVARELITQYRLNNTDLKIN